MKINQNINIFSNKRKQIVFLIICFIEFFITAIVVLHNSAGSSNPIFLGLTLKRLFFVLFIFCLSLIFLFLALFYSQSVFNFLALYFKLAPRIQKLLLAISISWEILSTAILFYLFWSYRTNSLFLNILGPLLFTIDLVIIQFWGIVWSIEIHQLFLKTLSKLLVFLKRFFSIFLHPEFLSEKVRSQVKRINFFWGFLFFISIMLFAFTIYRATTYPFMHDESLSFAIFNYQPYWNATANNHLLNTYLMKLCSSLFGNSELSLRFPNVLAHLLFLISSLLIIKRLQSAVLQMIGYMLINLNPFVLIYFFLARGYGLALAFQMLSLYLIILAYEKKKLLHKYTFVVLFSTFAGMLAVLANFTFLNFFLPLLFVSIWLLFSDENFRLISFKNLTFRIVYLISSGAFLVFILLKTMELRKNGQLYFGGSSGFIIDTVNSLLRNTFNPSPSISNLLVTSLIVIFSSIIFISLIESIIKKYISIYTFLVIILILAVALPILQHSLLQTNFPIERAALYYIPLFSITLIFGIQTQLLFVNKRVGRIIILLIPTLVVSLIYLYTYRVTSSLTYTLATYYEMHDKQILNIIDNDRKINFPNQMIKISNSWQMEPTLNFYRFTNSYSWLENITREKISITNVQYIYAFKNEIEGILQEQNYQILAYYSDTDTILLRINQADVSNPN